MREVWVADLAACGLVKQPTTQPPSMMSAAVPAAVPATGHDAVPAQSTSSVAAEGAHAEGVDSDDASDAYSSGEDEDDPLAEVMDELERAAVDLDLDVEEEAVERAIGETIPSADVQEGLASALETEVC